MPAPTPAPVDAESERIRSILFNLDPLDALRFRYKNFADFLGVVWQHAIPGSPEPSRLQKEMADYMQHGPLHRMILGFRGVAKSYIAAAYSAFLLFHDAEERIKLLSGSDVKSAEFSSWSSGLRKNEGLVMLHHLRGKSHQRDSVAAWDVGPSSMQQAPSFSATTVNSAIQGGRCSLGIWDDCEQKSNSDTVVLRDKILRRMTDVANMLIPEKNHGLLALGTYQTLASIYDTLIRERGFDVFYVPARVPADAKQYGGKLAPSIEARAAVHAEVGKPTEARFSEEFMQKIEQTIGPTQWQLEWMMSTAHGDRFEYPFPLDRMVVWDGVNEYVAPEKLTPGCGEDCRILDLPFLGLPGDGFYRPMVVHNETKIPFSNVILAIDPSGGSDNGDECAWVVMGAVYGQLHLIHVGGSLKGSDPKTIQQIVTVAERYKVREIVYESNMAAWGALLEQALKEKKVGVRLTPERAGVTGKNLRIIRTIEPVLFAGALIVSEKALREEYDTLMRSNAPRWKERTLQHQMAFFRSTYRTGESKLAYDDRLDCLSIAVRFLAEKYLKTGTEASADVERRKDDLAKERDFHSSAWGGTMQEPTWAPTRR